MCSSATTGMAIMGTPITRQGPCRHHRDQIEVDHPACAEDECLSYILSFSRTDPTIVVVAKKWRSHEDLDTKLQTVHIQTVSRPVSRKVFHYRFHYLSVDTAEK